MRHKKALEDILSNYAITNMARKEHKSKSSDNRKLKRKEKENLWSNRKQISNQDQVVVHYPKDRSALQTLHKESSKARQHHFFQSGLNHDWVAYYEQNVSSDQSCVNEWNAMDSLESKRPPSPDSLSNKEETELLVRSKLKEIMMSVDIDEVTSKFIRQKLESQLQMDLFQYKSFIDQEMLIILGQMDAATEVFPHVYLGSEWNASNLEELKKNGIGYILNVTKEIDNFFPGMFDYLNIRVYDDEKTELLKHWDDTYKYISRAKNKNSKVLVHCKMGISRSASVVIAYAMKSKKLTLGDATELVRRKRTCIKPNQAFMSQLKIYQGILDASRQRHNALWRSKSETNLNSPSMAKMASHHKSTTICGFADNQQNGSYGGDSVMGNYRNIHSMKYLCPPGTPNRRPKSWSPDDGATSRLFFNMPQTIIDFGETLPKSLSLNEKTWQAHVTVRQWDLTDPKGTLVCSVSPNEAINYFYVDKDDSCQESAAAIMESLKLSTSVKDRINEFENPKEIFAKSVKVDQCYIDGIPTSCNSDFVDGESLLCDVAEPQSTSNNVMGNYSNEKSYSESACDDLQQVKYQEKDCPDQCINNAIGRDHIADPKVVEKAADRKREDLFSESVDRVFDKEETTSKAVPPASDINEPHSRNSSWGSFDSAVFLADREAPSRQSSWGSCDTRMSTGSLLSRNNSYGAFDCKPAPHLYEVDNAKLESNVSLGFSKEGSSYSPTTLRRNRANCKCSSLESTATVRPKLSSSAENTKLSSNCPDRQQASVSNHSPELNPLSNTHNSNCVSGNVPRIEAHNHFVRSFSSSCVNMESGSQVGRSYSEKRGRYDTVPTIGKVRKITRAIEALDKQPDIFRQRSLSLDRLSAVGCNETPLQTSCSMRSSQTLLTELVIQTEAEAEKLSKENEEVDVKILVNRFESEANDSLPVVDSHSIFSGIFRNGKRKIRPRSDSMGEKVLPPVPQRKSSLDLHKGGRRHIGQLRQSLSWSPSYKPTVVGIKPTPYTAPNKPPVVPVGGRSVTCGVELRQKKQQGKSHPLSKLASKEKRL